MFFSAQTLTRITRETAFGMPLRPTSLQDLLYHLGLPGEKVPSYIASLILNEPEICGSKSHFAKRLAFGVLDETLSLYDYAAQHRIRTRLCRQVNRIQYLLEKESLYLPGLSAFERLLQQQSIAAVAVSPQGLLKQCPLPSERAILVEETLEALIMEEQLTKKLLERVISRFSRTERCTLAERVEMTLHEGLANPPLEEIVPEAQYPRLYLPQEPVRFGRQLLEYPQLHTLVEKTIRFFSSLGK